MNERLRYTKDYSASVVETEPEMMKLMIVLRRLPATCLLHVGSETRVKRLEENGKVDGIR